MTNYRCVTSCYRAQWNRHCLLKSRFFFLRIKLQCPLCAMRGIIDTCINIRLMWLCMSRNREWQEDDKCVLWRIAIGRLTFSVPRAIIPPAILNEFLNYWKILNFYPVLKDSEKRPSKRARDAFILSLAKVDYLPLRWGWRGGRDYRGR